jgi:hypothetical protein
VQKIASQCNNGPLAVKHWIQELVAVGSRIDISASQGSCAFTPNAQRAKRRATRATAVAPRHVGRGPGLVDQDQALWIQFRLARKHTSSADIVARCNCNVTTGMIFQTDKRNIAILSLTAFV